jgi:tetratricopeptide (TPR) repeat protein
MNTVDKGPPQAVSVDNLPVQRASIADIWRVPRAVWRARRALDKGEMEAARSLVAPLLGPFGTVTFVRKIAAEILYASGDPLSAAALFEQVAKRLPEDRAVAVGLVASYAALNRAGDARRSAALLPEHIDVRLALAWAELVALGGDPDRGAALVAQTATDPELARSVERVAMHEALEAIVAGRSGDRDGARAKLRRAELSAPKLRAGDRAFLGYHGGVALRQAGLVDDAVATFALAMDAAPESIGSALARRERANLTGAPPS